MAKKMSYHRSGRRQNPECYRGHNPEYMGASIQMCHCDQNTELWFMTPMTTIQMSGSHNPEPIWLMSAVSKLIGLAHVLLPAKVLLLEDVMNKQS